MEPRNIRECVLYTQDGKIFNGFEPINIKHNEDDIKNIHEQVPIEVRQPSTITIPLRDIKINKKTMKCLELYYRARKYLHYLKHSKKLRTRLKYTKKLHMLYIQETTMRISRRRM